MNEWIDVSRILLLLIFLLWMAGTSDTMPLPPDSLWLDLGLFIGFYILLIAVLGLWSRRIARRVASSGFHRTLRRFNHWMLAARVLIPGWFAVALFGLGWGWVVDTGLGMGALEPLKLPGLLVGTLPPMLAWMGLWWAQFPAERALREQYLLNQLEDGLPLHAPPNFTEYIFANFRLQILFTLIPILLIVLIRDVLVWLIFGSYPLHGSGESQASRDLLEFASFLGASAMVFMVAPELLRRVLKTSPLPDGPLRRRLETMCRRTGVRCREILVWHTQYNMGNAAVMGIVPQLRYVLLSDLLLERMTDEQIEAVFAHEAGHVVHRHMLWYVIFFLILVLGAAGPMALASDWLDRLALPPALLQPLGLAIGACGFWIIFGFISRRFERQADVFAARVIESEQIASPPPAQRAPARQAPTSHVGPYGATLFASALHRVAIINNVPVCPRVRGDGGMLPRMSYLLGSFLDLAHDWLHGSIPSRMAYLHGLSADPSLTSRFDRLMGWLYCALLFTLFASAAWTWFAIMSPLP